MEYRHATMRRLGETLQPEGVSGSGGGVERPDGENGRRAAQVT